ncbi:venom allergen 3-like isoform X2 [Tribolium madens]|uniref:venom allergen 3-like isoform X2 n=1 Tax=Tribolium madens TaxID=41895 RepID=UPI001CF75F96|nr:venom allergen 3-like isoform X2 [Tribolium madens]
MFKSILCIAACFSCLYGEKFDPRKRKYCDMRCPELGNVVHTACNCTPGEGREEVGLDKMVEFREIVVEEHNKLRNKIASGADTRNGASSASDMMVVNYDLELEYISRCYLRSTFNGYHDKCRTMPSGRDAGQNLAGQSVKDYSFALVKEFINDWYEEITDLQPDIIDKFHTLEHGKFIGHFTTVVWSTINKIGCARSYTKDPKKLKFIYEAFVQTLLCNYDITVLKECPDNLKCNSKYTSLCGGLEPIPTDPPYDFNAPDKNNGKSRGKNTATQSLTIASLLVITISSSLNVYFMY